MSHTQPRLLLLSNDDGIDSPGLSALATHMSTIADLLVAAPATEQSAQSHRFTLAEPVRAASMGPGRFAINGSPADCVYLGLHHLCPRPPVAVVSGINRGSNLGQDIHYSGTVAAAHEAALAGFPALAVSLAIDIDKRQPHHWDSAAHIAVQTLQRILRDPLPPGTVANLNVPNRPLAEIGGLKITTMGDERYEIKVDERRDPRGRRYYWLGGRERPLDTTPGTDEYWLARGCATLTPLTSDRSCRESFIQMADWDLEPSS